MEEKKLVDKPTLEKILSEFYREFNKKKTSEEMTEVIRHYYDEYFSKMKIPDDETINAGGVDMDYSEFISVLKEWIEPPNTEIGYSRIGIW